MRSGLAGKGPLAPQRRGHGRPDAPPVRRLDAGRKNWRRWSRLCCNLPLSGWSTAGGFGGRAATADFPAPARGQQIFDVGLPAVIHPHPPVGAVITPVAGLRGLPAFPDPGVVSAVTSGLIVGGGVGEPGLLRSATGSFTAAVLRADGPPQSRGGSQTEANAGAPAQVSAARRDAGHVRKPYGGPRKARKSRAAVAVTPPCRRDVPETGEADYARSRREGTSSRLPLQRLCRNCHQRTSRYIFVDRM